MNKLKRQTKKTMIWAHRGSSADRPENTMAAFERALELGADGIELDVHLSKDGVPVVIHDESFARTSNARITAQVKDSLWAECQNYNLCLNYTDKEYPLVSLAAVLERFRAEAISINIELKTDVYDYPGICEKVLEICESSGFPWERLYFSSFNAKTLSQLHQLKADLKLGYLFSKVIRKPEELAARHAATALHPHYALLFLPLYLWSLRKKYAIYTWTVDHPLVLRYLLMRRVDAVITNHPARALAIRDKLQ